MYGFFICKPVRIAYEAGSETPWKCELTDAVLLISTPFCFKQNVNRGKSDRDSACSLNVGHFLYQCVFIINASRLKCLFPHSNVLFRSSLILEKKKCWEKVAYSKTANKKVTHL